MIMGKDVEPMTIYNLAGIVLVCIGFLAYSGYGLAPNFLVAQVRISSISYYYYILYFIHIV